MANHWPPEITALFLLAGRRVKINPVAAGPGRHLLYSAGSESPGPLQKSGDRVRRWLPLFKAVTVPIFKHLIFYHLQHAHDCHVFRFLESGGLNSAFP